MKKIIAALAVTAMVAVGFAGPANAGPRERNTVKTLLMITFYDRSYADQDTLCWGWLNFPQMAYKELAPAFNGMKISKSDIRAGIRAAFNEVC